MANPEHVEILKQGVEVWNRWRAENTKIVPDLSREDLAGFDLSCANLGNAKLPRTDLSETNLTGSVLIEADLHRSNLNGAKLSGSDFSNAYLFMTSFAGVDLQNVVGLEYVRHLGPSHIGIDTIYRSNGKLPEKFLRGCGVPENFITYMKSLTMNPIEFYSCFISYSHQDKSFARRLHDQLQARGIRCWLDEHHLLPGDDIYEQVDRGIKLWDKVLLCCSEHSLTSWWVDNEVSTALEKEQRLQKERGKPVLAIIPLNLDGYLFDEKCTYPKASQLRKRLAADFTGWETDNAKFEEQFERVVLALRTEGAREEAPVSRL